MPQYLVAGYLPDDFDPSQADEAMGRAIHALNKEMIAAGVRKERWRSPHHRRAIP